VRILGTNIACLCLGDATFWLLVGVVELEFGFVCLGDAMFVMIFHNLMITCANPSIVLPGVKIHW
jgi:hypothetical protein